MKIVNPVIEPLKTTGVGFPNKSQTVVDRTSRRTSSGTDLYLTKPFNPTKLIAFVPRILG
jgi:hypothetical protein